MCTSGDGVRIGANPDAVFVCASLCRNPLAVASEPVDDSLTAMTRRSTRSVTFPRGFRAAGATCGIKPSGNADIALIVADDTCTAAGVFTRNKVVGAPVTVSRRHIRSGVARAIVCNSGISNVCTGEQGLADAKAMCAQTAELVGCKTRDVLVCSTGVIGPHLPMDKVGRGIATAASKLGTGNTVDLDTARAIMTTDLVPKYASTTATIDDKTVRFGGIAKGSGMIAPNMATMLCFVTTDAAIESPAIKAALKQAVDQSFNRISVDHDTSTSDSVLVLASGGAKNQPIKPDSPVLDTFTKALRRLLQDLAYQVVKDGEGATRVFHVKVTGAKSEKDADRVGHTIVGSPLVKTAVHGSDPNWGRFMMAVGRSGAQVKAERTELRIAGHTIFKAGRPVRMTEALEKKLIAAMSKSDVDVHVDLGMGKATAIWLGCDLSREYIAINADYTT